MKERIQGAFTKKKIFHFLKMALFVVALSLILLSLLGTVAHRKDTRCVHKKEDFPLSQNGSVRGGTLPYPAFTSGDGGSCDGASWSWLPWNWLDGIVKSVQYGL